MTLDHKLGALEGVSFQVIDVDCTIGIIFTHLSGVLPSKEILGTVSLGDSWVEGAELEAIKLAIDEDRRVLLILAFGRESCDNSGGRFAKLTIAIYFNLIRLVLLFGWRQPEADALIWRPDYCLDALFGRLPPDEFAHNSTRTSIDDTQIRVVWVVEIVLLADEKVCIPGRVLEHIDILLRDK